METQRKRKRDDADGQDSTPLVKDHGGTDTGSLAKRGTSTASSHPNAASHSEPSSVIPWPEELKALSRIHRALNVVYTFCCTRQHYTTTFEKIRGSVESQTGGRPLTIEDVAKVKFLIPQSVRFELSDTGVVSIMGVAEARKKKVPEIWNDWEAEGMGSNGSDGGKRPPDTELLFEFVDGDLKPESQPGVGLGGYEDIRTPVYIQKKMVALIEKRNKKFTNAVDTFLAVCRQENVDPVQRLEAGKDIYMPLSPDSGSSTPAAAKLPAQIPKIRRSIAEIISEIKEQSWYYNQIVKGGGAYEGYFGIDEVKLTDIDGSPSGRKEFLCWQTPYKDPNDASSGRGSSIDESAKIFCQLILRGVRVIAFCRIRKQCEYLLNAIKDEFRTLDRPDVSRFVMGYRGGYSPQDRRKIEREMFEGKLLGIVATNALELGVDIGTLDAVITHEFPHSISNFRQQSGRAGRRNKDSLSILVAGQSAADQHYMNNPDDLFTKPNCGLLVDLENELVLEGHVQCAAFEMPIHPENDSAYFGSQLAHLADTRLVKDDMGFYHCHERFRPNPSKFVSIRSIDEGNYAIIDTTNNRNVVIEEIDDARVFFTVYEGAIYFHQGNTYLVKELNTSKRFARVVRAHVDWITEQRDFTNVDPIETEAIRRISRLTDYRAFFGKIAIHTLVYGYFKKDKKGRILDAVALDTPPIDKMSKGLWLDVPKTALEILKSHNLNAAAAIHAASMQSCPYFRLSDFSRETFEQNAKQGVLSRDQDPRTRNHFFHPLAPPTPRRQRQARLVFYDAKGGSSGSGITSKAFEFIDSLLVRANSRIDTCTCTAAQGCVECVCNELCPEMNLVISKAGASVILKCLLGLKVDVDSLPWGTELDRGYEPGPGSELAQGLETIIEAVEVAGASGKEIRIYDLDT
ncbi:DEAD/DEAH box helicase [Trichophyton equinum CBS 127.97]|uniref:DEAD/DEAH box helicase n=1 Tax=Trichophyton equinum (strain ATCC MYA-4606 / CBS 127.97) TaxID=559882 RepID=F2PXP3_TRIEC|nr:DEAD/DEAH box helicase [Trichophyton equinum CBS 127.97]